jgi:tripartite-type tricarboxylate transporter receptor subunit TctC
MKTTSTRRFSLKALAAMLAVVAAPLTAQAWTDKPVKLIVPAPPGGSIDIVARLLAEALSSDIGHTVIVENKPGAGGAIAIQAMNAAPPDGQTILVLVSNILTEIPLVMKTTFDPFKDVTPVTSVCRANMVLVSAASLPAADMKGLVDYLKTTKGGKGSYATYSAGTASHYAGVMFAKKTGLDMQHVPFPGSPPALQQVMGGQIDIMFDGMATSLPQIKGGKLKAYAVASKTRSVHLPDVPTTAEVGFAEIDVSNWVGTVVSSKVPADLMGKINIATVKAAMSPKVRDRLIAAGFEPTVSDSPDKLAQMVKADYERNAQIVKAFNIQLSQ